MALVTTKEMFEKSMKEGYAIGAFNVNNMEIIQAIMDAAAEAKSPVILQTSSSAIKYARLNYLMKMVEAAVEEHPEVPVAIHLDHGPDFETAKMCIDAGFTSVMIDGSKYDFEENIALTKKVVDYAHAHGVVVEAELGKLAGIAASALKIKPIITLKEGEIFNSGITRSRQKSMQKVVEMTEKYLDEVQAKPGEYSFCIGYGYDYEEAVGFREMLKDLIRERLGIEEIGIYQIGATIGVHTGPYPIGIGIVRHAEV